MFKDISDFISSKTNSASITCCSRAGLPEIFYAENIDRPSIKSYLRKNKMTMVNYDVDTRFKSGQIEKNIIIVGEKVLVPGKSNRGHMIVLSFLFNATKGELTCKETAANLNLPICFGIHGGCKRDITPICDLCEILTINRKAGIPMAFKIRSKYIVRVE